jgi:ketosteroid isomerase-like protein
MGRGPETLLDSYGDLFTDDFEWTPVLAGRVEGRTYRGREGFAEYWRDFTDAFERVEFVDPGFEVVDLERVLVLTRFEATGTGGGVPLSADIAHLWKLRDGRIAAGRTFLSEREARKHLSG